MQKKQIRIFYANGTERVRTFSKSYNAERRYYLLCMDMVEKGIVKLQLLDNGQIVEQIAFTKIA